MAGYMTKLQGYVYEGEFVNGTGTPVENGLLVAVGTGNNIGKMVLPEVNAGTKFICKEATTIYGGIPAYRFIVKAVADPLYLVENGFEINVGEGEYDTRAYATKANAYLRAHPLLVGEEFVTDKVTGEPEAGTEYTVKADGTIG